MAVPRGAGLVRPVRAIELGHDSGGLVMADTLICPSRHRERL
ncbi:hypothetical protein ACIBHY_53705 [Nonomuraea sp. NPDC050547]